MLTQKHLRELLVYRDGDLIWSAKVYGHGGQKKGHVAGTVSDAGNGYLRRRIGIRGKIYMAHHLVFLYHHGFIPKQLDHIDRNPLNNRIENLRVADDSQQEANKKIRSDNKSGYRGVFWNKQKSKWHAKICKDKLHIDLGRFHSAESAAAAYNKAAKKLFGAFAYLNEIPKNEGV